MKVIAVSGLPVRSFLDEYRKTRAYTDGFCIDVPVIVSLPAYLEAFYTTQLFKLERLILALLAGKPSSDAQARRLAVSDGTRFAAWTVEARAHDQILMCDYMSKTRSWLMCEPQGAGATRLYFGSAIVAERILPDGRVDLGLGFHLLLGFHRLYSVALLRAAAFRLLRSGNP